MPVDLNALFAPAAIAFVISATVIWALIRSRVSALALDRPNARSLHDAPTPRIGGLGILAGLAAGIALSAW
jgi:UDP-N-acetylmuramyl pentapeptide phosphotransferase/UDP-N-acetylglucosamine-1-phosphate transferase